MENFTEILTEREATPYFWEGPRDITILINSFEKVDF